MTPHDYLTLGWHLLPIKPGTKRPLDGQGLKHASNDPAVIDRWAKQNPDWAVACQASGIVVLDVDQRHGGVESWFATVKLLGDLPNHPTAQTRNGGDHHVFRDPGFACLGKLAAGIDIKRRGYILVAPSDGYQWIVWPDSIPKLPQRWLDAIRKDTPKPPKPPKTATPRTTAGTTHYGKRALDGELDRLRGAREGDRNATLNNVAIAVGELVAGGEIVRGDGEDALHSVAIGMGLTEHETRATIQSGLNHGMKSPRSAQNTPSLAYSAPQSYSTEPPPPDEYPVVDLGDDIPGADDWRRGLTWKTLQSGTRVLEKTAGNLALLLAHAAGWKGCLAYDEFSGAPRWVDTPPPVPGMTTPSGLLKDTHFTWLKQAARLAWQVNWTSDGVSDAARLAAEANPVHPVQDYLSGLVWDGTERLTTWLQDYLGAEETEVPIGRWWMLSAVARSGKPGCQVDHVLVLQGAQGAGKSTAVRILGGEWYSGNLGDLRNKDAMLGLRGKWVLEIGELDALRGAAFPRQCVFCGTTNEAEFLQDVSGARRFWPVTVRRVKRQALERDRDQLWAEAVAAYEDGERWWPAGEYEARKLAAAAEERFAVDPWEDKLSEWLAVHTHEELTIGQVLAVMGVDEGRQTMWDSKRIAKILQRCGWTKQHTRQGNRWTK
jgi:hypothetical protein